MKAVGTLAFAAALVLSNGATPANADFDSAAIKKYGSSKQLRGVDNLAEQDAALLAQESGGELDVATVITTKLRFVNKLTDDADQFVADVKDWLTGVVGDTPKSEVVVGTDFSLETKGDFDLDTPCGGLTAYKTFDVIKQFLGDPKYASLDDKSAETIMWHPSKDCVGRKNSVEVDGGSHVEFVAMCGDELLLNVSSANGGLTKTVFFKTVEATGAFVAVDFFREKIQAIGATGRLISNLKLRSIPDNVDKLLKSWTNALRECAVQNTLEITGVVGGGWKQKYSKYGGLAGAFDTYVLGYAESFKIKYQSLNVPTEAPVTPTPTTQAPVTPTPTTQTPVTEAPATAAPETKAPATEAPAAETPATEAPASETPTEPVAETPTTEEPAGETEEPVTEIPASGEPVTEPPASEKPTSDEPAPEDPTTETPIVETPASEEPTSDKPTSEEPASEEPTSEEPASEEPVSKEPVTEAPAAETPASDEPTSEEPVSEIPTSDEPTSNEPASEEPTSEEPVTETPTADTPVPEEPASDEPITETPASDEPTSDEPVIETPASEEPVSDEPTSDEPVTETPSTKTPSSAEPATDEPVSETPASDEPALEEPASDEPVTETPTSEAPASEEPVTEAPADNTTPTAETPADEATTEPTSDAPETPTEAPTTDPGTENAFEPAPFEPSTTAAPPTDVTEHPNAATPFAFSRVADLDLASSELKVLSDSTAHMYMQAGMECESKVSFEGGCFMNTAMSKVLHGSFGSVTLDMSSVPTNASSSLPSGHSLASFVGLGCLAAVLIAFAAKRAKTRHRHGYAAIPSEIEPINAEAI